jgi:hypothetical protein
MVRMSGDEPSSVIRATASQPAAAPGAATSDATRFLRGCECLRQKRFGLWRARGADASRTNAEIVVSPHRARARCATLSKNNAMAKIASRAGSSQCSKHAGSCTQIPTDRPAAPCGLLPETVKADEVARPEP